MIGGDRDAGTGRAGDRRSVAALDAQVADLRGGIDPNTLFGDDAGIQHEGEIGRDGIVGDPIRIGIERRRAMQDAAGRRRGRAAFLLRGRRGRERRIDEHRGADQQRLRRQPVGAATSGRE